MQVRAWASVVTRFAVLGGAGVVTGDANPLDGKLDDARGGTGDSSVRIEGEGTG